jgi:hypothetical protein
MPTCGIKLRDRGSLELFPQLYPAIELEILRVTQLEIKYGSKDLGSASPSGST